MIWSAVFVIEVNMYIDAPPGINSASTINCNITATHLFLGLKGAPNAYLDEDFGSKVLVNESSWYLDNGVIYIVLVKAHRGETWESCLKGNHQFQGAQTTIDPVTKQQIQKDMLLERFQEEHPGFDFRGAEFNGSAPDPRTFLGGINHS